MAKVDITKPLAKFSDAIEDERTRILAGRVVEAIWKSGYYVLPSVREMAADFRVATSRMLQVLKCLREIGLIEPASSAGGFRVRRGTGFRPLHKEKSGSSVDRLYEELRSRIVDGFYADGQELPKIDYFIVTRRVSNHSVQKVYDRLAKEGLALRQGKKLLVVRDTLPSARKVAGAREILIVGWARDAWKRVMESQRAGEFARSFMLDLAYQNLTCQLAVSGSSLGDTDEGVLVGDGKIDSWIRHRAASLAGILVVGQPGPYDTIENEAGREVPVASFGIMATIGRLLTFSRPVVWFDAFDHARLFGRERKDRWNKLTSGAHDRGMLVRVHADERSAAELATQTIFELGHRSAMFVTLTDEHHGWARDRWQLIVDEAERHCPGLDVSVFLTIGSDSQKAVALSQIENAIKSTQSTAIIAANDEAAVVLYRFLCAAHIRIPTDVSLISFDNDQQRLFPLPISSIDFGSQALGALTVSLLSGQTASPRSGADMSTPPRINHSGTLAPLRHENRVGPA